MVLLEPERDKVFPVIGWQLTRGYVPQDINACAQVFCNVAAV